MAVNIHNPFAPAAVAGLNSPAAPGEADLKFDYVFDITLVGGQNAPAQVIPIDSDSDFVLRGIYYSWPTGTNGNFVFRFYDSQNFALSSGMVYNSNLSNDPSAPTLWLPELTYPAGGKIQLDIADVSGAPNVIEIVFTGVKRFRVS